MDCFHLSLMQLLFVSLVLPLLSLSPPPSSSLFHLSSVARSNSGLVNRRDCTIGSGTSVSTSPRPMEANGRSIGSLLKGSDRGGRRKGRNEDGWRLGLVMEVNGDQKGLGHV